VSLLGNVLKVAVEGLLADLAVVRVRRGRTGSKGVGVRPRRRFQTPLHLFLELEPFEGLVELVIALGGEGRTVSRGRMKAGVK
jgi:hypothetical protein